MRMNNVDSRCIEAMTYENCTLVVRFTSGAVYAYQDVPRYEYERLEKAPSRGKYLNTNIKPNYAYAKLTR